tara:strand:+ start:346 stop:1395 length:1050 start_codon:yes stop_codon:yes gene_type:complete
MKHFPIIFLFTLIIFIFFNALIVLTWPLYSNYNDKKHSYSSEQKKLLKLDEKDLITLYNETWKNYDKFRFIPFLGHSETNRVGKFVNFSEENGRKINRPDNCKNFVYLYGGSTTFGYNVTDNQTIGYYLQDFFDNETCVYNHGRAYYYSKQENNLFINHIENKKKIDTAIFLDGINERCGGYEYMHQLNKSFNFYVERPFLMWKNSLKNLMLSLPIVQAVNALFGSSRWIDDNNNSILNIESCGSKTNLGELYDVRIKVRSSICAINKINCFSFLQPMAGSHGKQIEKFLNDEGAKKLNRKYKLLSSANNKIDLGYVLKNESTLSYIDAVHYSPSSNKKIAEEIYKLVN